MTLTFFVGLSRIIFVFFLCLLPVFIFADGESGLKMLTAFFVSTYTLLAIMFLLISFFDHIGWL